MASSTEVYKILTAAMSAIILTGASGWFVFGSNSVSREEMADFLAKTSPWVIDRGEITAAVSGNAKNIDKLAEVCNKLIEAQQELLIQQRVTITRIEALLDKDP